MTELSHCVLCVLLVPLYSSMHHTVNFECTEIALLTVCTVATC